LEDRHPEPVEAALTPTAMPPSDENSVWTSHSPGHRWPEGIRVEDENRCVVIHLLIPEVRTSHRAFMTYMRGRPRMSDRIGRSGWCFRSARKRCLCIVRRT